MRLAEKPRIPREHSSSTTSRPAVFTDNSGSPRPFNTSMTQSIAQAHEGRAAGCGASLAHAVGRTTYSVPAGRRRTARLAHSAGSVSAFPTSPFPRDRVHSPSASRYPLRTSLRVAGHSNLAPLHVECVLPSPAHLSQEETSDVHVPRVRFIDTRLYHDASTDSYGTSVLQADASETHEKPHARIVVAGHPFRLLGSPLASHHIPPALA